MTYDDAKSLVDNSLMDDALNNIPKPITSATWIEKYKKDTLDWQPFDNNSIKDLVYKALQDLGPDNYFYPDFIDIKSVHSRRKLIKKLRSEGCLLIIDSLSLHHPALQEAIYNSKLDISNKTAILNIFPSADIVQAIRNLEITIRKHISDMEFSIRGLDKDEEVGVILDAFDENNIERWILDRLKKDPRVGYFQSGKGQIE
jgi:hypothetical protein